MRGDALVAIALAALGLGVIYIAARGTYAAVWAELAHATVATNGRPPQEVVQPFKDPTG